MSHRTTALALVACAGAVVAACSSPAAHRADTTTSHRHATTSTSTLSTSSTTSSTSTPTHSTTTSTTSSAPGSSTTSGAAALGCNRMSASASSSQGAAGTIIGVITVTNTGSGTCTARGYPTMALYGSGGTPLTVAIVDGLSVSSTPPANGAPATTTIGPSATAQFTYQFSDVPTGTETSCPTSASASVTIPGAATASPNFDLAIAPCNHGTIRVSPLYSSG